jgi:hypothetical protein
MMIKRLLITVFILSTLYSCSSSVKPKEQANIPQKDTSVIGRFLENFDSSKLPLLIPDDLNGKTHVIDSKVIENLCADKSFTSPFTVKDVPDLGKNAGASQYYGEKMFLTSKKGIYGVIIRKKDQGEYYFLCTMNAKAEMIGGICVAFQEGDGVNILERNATVNDDYSIQVMQSDVSGAKDPTSKSVFFEISADGSINLIKKGI